MWRRWRRESEVLGNGFVRIFYQRDTEARRVKRGTSTLGVLAWLLCTSAVAGGQTSWPCISEIAKAESGGHAIRVSAGVASRLVQKKVLPDISDLKGKKLDSLVVVDVILDTKGTVRCARAEEGDADLLPRSVEAAEQWQFKPFQLNGETLVVNTQIQFKYKKNKVEVVVPSR
jgi:hypothetical protein